MMEFLLTVNAPPPLLAAAGDVLFLILPILGSILLSYGVFQAVMETRASSQKKVKERLRGGSSSKAEQAVNDIIRRSLGDDKSFANAALGKLSFIPKLQTMLDQADIHWSAAQTMLNLAGLALLATMVPSTASTMVASRARPCSTSPAWPCSPPWCSRCWASVWSRQSRAGARSCCFH